MNSQQLQTILRYIVAIVSGAIGMFAALHMISAGDAQNAVAAINSISDSVAKIAAALVTLSAAAVTIVGAIKSNPLTQLLSGAKAVAADPKLAAAVPFETQKVVADATANLSEVQTVVGSAKLAANTNSESVVATAA